MRQDLNSHLRKLVQVAHRIKRYCTQMMQGTNTRPKTSRHVRAVYRQGLVKARCCFCRYLRMGAQLAVRGRSRLASRSMKRYTGLGVSGV